MADKTFSGPLFIVGMPRSGTKLLRDLLNQHSQIGIPVVESVFIPHLVSRFGLSLNLEDDQILRQFYGEFQTTTFYFNMKLLGREMSFYELLQNLANGVSWEGALEAIFRYYAPSGKEDHFIWGDKTPSYLRHMKLLKEILPGARFIHIIRDPRDCSLSINKAWGKNLYRAAESWRSALELALIDSKSIGSEYLQVYYEALLDTPELTLSKICSFLGCDYTEAMTRLGRAAENLGDRSNETLKATRIIPGNQQKYRTQLTTQQIKRIEEIVWPVLPLLHYQAEQALKYRRLHPTMNAFYRWFDGLTWLRFHIREKGIKNGIKYSLLTFQQSS